MLLKAVTYEQRHYPSPKSGEPCQVGRALFFIVAQGNLCAVSTKKGGNRFIEKNAYHARIRMLVTHTQDTHLYSPLYVIEVIMKILI